MLILISVLLTAGVLPAQSPQPDLERRMWPAQWITVPETDPEAYGVYLFRKEIEVAGVPDSFPMLITADNQYELFVNGSFVNRGAAKGDLDHWNYDRLDLAPFLIAGTNSLAVRVWNAGDFRQEAQISYGTGLIVQAASPISAPINTGDSWVCRQDRSYRPVPVSVYGPRPGMIGMYGYYVAGPGDRVDMAQRIDRWETIDFDDSEWQPARAVSPGVPRNTVGMDARQPWRLVPSPIPPMQRTPERFAAVRRAAGVTVPDDFLAGTDPLTIPAGTTATLLLDQSYLTNAFPTITLGGGAGASVVLTYAEALYEDDLRTKNNRNEVEGKTILGRQDSIFTDGTAGQTFTPLSYRTYRYVQVEITTAEDPLTIADISAVAVGFPFERRAKLSSPLPEMDTLLDIGWRTARMCAMDTYMDCPYWEQLQYIGDTRIQALVSLYETGDDRLVKNALNLMHFSRQPEGITTSRYPTNIKQIIGPFSLWYIGMLRDYMWYGTDRAFIQDKLFGVRQILDYFGNFQDANGSLRDLPNWSFTDWVEGWPRGIAPLDDDGHSAVLDLQLLLAFEHATQLEAELGMTVFAQQYREQAERLATTIRDQYWDAGRGLFADTKAHDHYSQHANSLAILAGIVPEKDRAALANRMLDDEDLAPASIYFRYYLHRALAEAGMGNDYLDWLDVWRTNLELGLTTWAEDSDVAGARSDCHAWGSSPNIEFYRTVLGIDSSAPHFRSVRIEPHLGNIRRISGEIPHPAGSISADYDLDAGTARIHLPADVYGLFVWRGKTTPLTGGANRLDLK
ncbi:family 78 glycoside hydrolase catalytic domain [Lewinella sp. JB7]|uniref:family 78 glycoside hydrolase catalytic domain n=1 Tax=Lewinella sp. JB7 TaxID=2962887 RepID=UPI0020C9BC50|nr:family 78 glycoside hydrolase catalytic domain [Lewinella sp. JB7]MCP9236192.1 alpha-rhamnosidase [Lewinella sp. JB7]